MMRIALDFGRTAFVAFYQQSHRQAGANHGGREKLGRTWRHRLGLPYVGHDFSDRRLRRTAGSSCQRQRSAHQC